MKTFVFFIISLNAAFTIQYMFLFNLEVSILRQGVDRHNPFEIHGKDQLFSTVVAGLTFFCLSAYAGSMMRSWYTWLEPKRKGRRKHLLVHLFDFVFSPRLSFSCQYSQDYP